MAGLRSTVREVVRTLTAPFLWTILSGINRGRKWRVRAGVITCWFGTYEKDEAALIAALIPPGAVVFDVGAHAGYYTLAASRLVGEKGRIVAFEPDPDNLRFLREHLSVNDVGNVTVIDHPVGERHGETASFVVNKEHSYESGVRSPDRPGGTPMTLVTLDRVIADGAPVPHIVKMDIEGGERGAIAGSPKVVGALSTSWLISLHGHEVAWAVIDALQKAGYAVHDVKDGSLLGEHPPMPVYSLLALPPGRTYPKVA
jgi:FkbM family methyltransferase